MSVILELPNVSSSRNFVTRLEIPPVAVTIPVILKDVQTTELPV